MHQQETDFQFFCQCAKRLQFSIIVAVGNIRGRGANQLEGVNHDEYNSRMLLPEFSYPIAHAAFDRGAPCCKIQSGRYIVRDGIEPFLNPAFGILQAKIQRFSLRNGKSP